MKYALTEQEILSLTDIWIEYQKKFSEMHQRIESSIPYIAINHRYEDVGEDKLTWWTNGFWAGSLWQMYYATKTEAYLSTARTIEERLDRNFEHSIDLDHDVGFIWLNASVSDYRITKNTKARLRGLRAAQILAARYHPKGEYILAWNGDEKQGQIIIDCLMNLPLLHWASDELEESSFSEMAANHAKTASDTLFRKDGSVNHIAVFNQLTGQFEKNLGGQGYDFGSSWSRGQAWGIYGSVLAYRDTREIKYLDQAKNVANYFISNVALTDWVSVIDFRAPQVPKYTDTSATAIAICGLLELVKYLPVKEQHQYVKAAYTMFEVLTSKFCNFNLSDDGILNGSSAKYHRSIDREVPIIYGDTFYLEALLRFLDLDIKIY